ncbi:uncharacterized protein ARMOST_18401 [Armillaria ostoyae]|uniref:Uncharacterized protein n=1 Tax=Armillaria ostoyae TaxID=47428 RepID=A0A284S1P4_ARMOS|nr:uncharacterized protein ARMOST_18401 [Armillaria ostoyae]
MSKQRVSVNIEDRLIMSLLSRQPSRKSRRDRKIYRLPALIFEQQRPCSRRPNTDRAHRTSLVLNKCRGVNMLSGFRLRI